MKKLQYVRLPLFITIFSVFSLLCSPTAYAEDVIFSDNTSSKVNVKADIKANIKEQRIITLAPHIIEMLFNLGVGNKVIATTEHSDYPEAANHVPRIGNYARLKLEKILAYEPDLIIAWRTGNPIDDLERLEKLGLNVVYSDPRNLDDVAKELRLLGKLTGSQERAEILAKRYESDLEKLRTTFANKAPISVFYELWPNPLTTISKNAWPQQHLNVCGATNSFSNSIVDYPQIGLEQVVIARPELIIQPISKGEKTPDAVNWFKFNEIPASIHKQIIFPNSDKLHRMTSRLLEELEELCVRIDNSRQYYLKHKLNKQSK